MINVVINQHDIQAKVDALVHAEIVRHVQSSPIINDAIKAAVATVKIDTAVIEACVAQAIKNVCSNPVFFEGMIQKAILAGADKLGGSFDASLRAAGKRLAMDGDLLEQVAAGVKTKLQMEAEERAAEYELKGGGSFA